MRMPPAMNSGFQIPMRGNEFLVPVPTDDREIGFQIPMRGNELTGSGLYASRIDPVPNPHEG